MLSLTTLDNNDNNINNNNDDNNININKKDVDKPESRFAASCLQKAFLPNQQMARMAL